LTVAGAKHLAILKSVRYSDFLIVFLYLVNFEDSMARQWADAACGY